MRRSKSCSRISGIPVSSSKQCKMSIQKTRSPSCGPQRRPSNSEVLSTPLYSNLPSWGVSDSARSLLFPPSATPYGVQSRRPGSSFGSRIGSSRGKSPTAGKKQVRPNDKKWVDEQYMKVKEFIRSSGLFNPALADQIKPPTMMIFVELVAVLLGRLAKTIPINSQNCSEELLKWLKILGYTGQMSAMTLRIVNTMHGWSQFISIIAFLIDRLNLPAQEERFRLQLGLSDQMALNLRDTLFDYLSQKCGQMAGPSEAENLDDNFYQALIAITGIDCDEVEKTKETLTVQRVNFEKFNAELLETQQKKEEIETQNLEKTSVIQEFEESGRNEEEIVKEELEQNKVSLQKLTETKEALTESLGKLQKQVAQQSYTVKDKDELIRQIEAQNRLLERAKEKQRQIQIVNDELDFTQGKLLSQIEACVDKWNISLKKTFLPEVISLRLREKGFLSKEDFGKEINEMLSKRTKLFEELLTEYRTALDELATLSKHKQLLVNDEVVIDAQKRKVDLIQTKNAALREQNEQLVVQIEQARTKHQTSLNQLKEEEEAKIRTLSKEIHDVEKQLKEVITNTDKTCKTYVAAITEVRNNIIQDAGRIKEEKIRKIKEVRIYLNQVKQRSAELMENFNELQQLKKFLSEKFSEPI